MSTAAESPGRLAYCRFMDRVETQLTPAQVRGARAMLNMTQDELASRAGVTRTSVLAFEADETTGRSIRDSTMGKLRRALEDAGAMFVNSDGRVGVLFDLERP